MNIVLRFFKRFRFRKSLKGDECENVVSSMVKARKLYKQLCIIAHPDRNPDRSELAQELMAKITANRYNYAELRKLSQIVDTELK